MIGDLKNVHILKDVGMFPYMLKKKGYFDSYIVSYGRLAEEFPNLDYTPGLKLVIRKKIFGNSIIDGCFWLVKNGKAIDILNLYHYRFSSFMWIVVYKIVNPHGMIWLKLDIDPSDGFKMSMKGLKRIMTKMILSLCKVVSSETRDFQSYANDMWPVKVAYVPNGICLAEILPFQNKEKVILTVGRLGTEQKATEVLLKAFVKSTAFISEDWKLFLVGSIEETFQKEIDILFSENKDLMDRIEFVGQVIDREILTAYYKKASIFTMPSRGEGFCLAAIEAIAKGDYLLTTNLISFKELTDNWTYGECFEIDNVEQYSGKIIKLCNDFDNYLHNDNKKDLKEFLSLNYSYENICGSLYHMLTM